MSPSRAKLPRPQWARLPPGVLAPGLVVVVLLADLLLWLLPWHMPNGAALDWTGHLATSGLVLLTVQRLGARLPLRTVYVALASSVAIDLDHLPLYAGVPHVAAAGGRPFTHCLLTLLLLVAVAAVSRRRVVLAMAAGVGMHLLRDLATGGPVPLLWPADVAVAVPYVAYLLVLLVLAAAVAWPRTTAQSPIGT
jgi:inner membrane protein